MPVRLSINAVTSAERQRVIDAIAAAVSELGGWIDDVHLFSNISVAIRSFLPPDRVQPFGERLAVLGLKLSDSAQRDLTAFAAAPGSAAEVLCTVQITFFHSEPDLRRPVPSVPG
jgi:hypothetical protein